MGIGAGKLAKGIRNPKQAATWTKNSILNWWVNRNAPDLFDQEWDVLIVLDACRVDTLREEVSDRENYDKVDSITSMASHSFRWLSYYREELTSENVAYVSGNPHTESVLDSDSCVEVWKSHWDSDIGTVRAESMTDVALHQFANRKPERLIVHYMQPHFPSIPHPNIGAGLDRGRGNEWEGSVWDMLDAGEIEESAVIEAYQANLRYVLTEVDILATELSDEKVAVTADHGNAFD